MPPKSREQKKYILTFAFRRFMVKKRSSKPAGRQFAQWFASCFLNRKMRTFSKVGKRNGSDNY